MHSFYLLDSLNFALITPTPQKKTISNIFFCCLCRQIGGLVQCSVDDDDDDAMKGRHGIKSILNDMI